MNHNAIAAAMCEVTDELLWQPRLSWARRKMPGAELTFRVGTGRKTYLRSRRGSSAMVITYGSKMIASKTDSSSMCKWLTAREIHERGYYGGQLTLLNVLSHTVAHEFGHCVQVILGRRYDGSVHNTEFYEILDRIHASEDADRIRSALHARCIDQGHDLRKITASQADLNALNGMMPNGEQALTMRDISIGEKLFFCPVEMQQFNPVRVTAKRRTRIVVASTVNPTQRWVASPGAFIRAHDASYKRISTTERLDRGSMPDA